MARFLSLLGEVTWVACEKRESDFLEGVTGLPERTKGIHTHFRSASDRISLPFPLLTSRRIDRATAL